LEGDSAGGSAHMKLFGNGFLRISLHTPPGTTIGSLEGDGLVVLGDNNLAVGADNRSTLFSGVIVDDDGFGHLGGSFSKIGSGTLTLTGANLYPGGTTLSEGTLVVNNTSGSGTGAGAVQVNQGVLAGSGTISGAVTIGIGTGLGAFLAPGKGAREATTLTIQSMLTFKADGIYTYRLNTRRAEADRVIANGITIESGAQFNFVAVKNRTLTSGTVFIAIDNTSANPISGTFANLADGSTFVVGNNTYQADYQGGDGNDLTLTVVP